MSTEEFLIQQYGPLLSLDELSKVLKRSREGLRLSLRVDNEFSRKWNSARIKVGRRVYFRSGEVGRLIDTDNGA